jgi:vitamin B12/bleomycin/antimicrobial peptide transport system ATP-binding/permease protein
MIPLSALVAVLTAAMAWCYFFIPGAVPEGSTVASASIPLYVIICGVIMAVTTFLSSRIYVFLRMFNAGYAIAFATFSVLFIVQANGGFPVWAPEWTSTLTPKPFLAFSFTLFAVIVLLISNLPIIHETIGLSELFFTSRDKTRVRFFIWYTSREGLIGTAFHLFGIIITLLQVYMGILFNDWWGQLFDTFEKKDQVAFWIAVSLFFVLALQWIVLAISDYLVGQYLLIRWRRFMSKEYVGEWLADDRHYKIQFSGEKADNPEQRVSEDIRSYVTSTSSLAGSLFSTFLSLAAFVQVLWDISTRFKSEGGEGWLVSLSAIPGFLVWICLAYAIFATLVGHYIGRPLIRLQFFKEKTEADFRYSMTRMREYSEQVALLDGKSAERAEFNDRYDKQVTATLNLVRTTAKFRIFSFTLDQLSDLFPYMLVAPAYFAGVGSLGGLQQTANAFSRVQGGFSIFLNLYEALAAYKTAVNRITGFRQAMSEASAVSGARSPIQVAPARDTDVDLENMEIALPDGRVIARISDLELKPGEITLVTGPSGSGKSTLFRAIAGIWPYGKGRIEVPEGKTVMLLPQKPYIPLGPLRAAIAYPEQPGTYDDAALTAKLELVGLSHLVPRLDEESFWAQALSGGEQQRIAIVRALLKKPDWLFLDEATAALDEPMEAKVYKLLKEELPNTTVVSIGHRATLFNFHSRRIDMKSNGDGTFTPMDTGARAQPAE